MDEMLPRRAGETVERSLESFRSVVVHGPRQAGKTTLVRELAGRRGMRSVTLDRREDKAAAASDPRTFLELLGSPAMIDEVQRGGDDLLLAIKERLDLDRRPGQYLLTGSTNFLTVPTLSESLAGRIDIVPLWPLSVGEVTGGDDAFVDRGFAGADAVVGHRGEAPPRTHYFDRVTVGGFPEVQGLPAPARRRWFARYAETVLQREVEVAADLRRVDALRTLVRYLAATTSGELAIAPTAARVGIDVATASSYLAWIEAAFLVHRLPAWTRGATARVVRRPKVHLVDAGLAASLVGRSDQALARLDEPMTGALLETFVAAELAKQVGWSEEPARLHHVRESNGLGVDVLLEADDGRVVAVEVKASASPRPDDARWLAVLRDRLDRIGSEAAPRSDFVVGVVLHTGDRRLMLGDRLVAVPIADLWT